MLSNRVLLLGAVMAAMLSPQMAAASSKKPPRTDPMTLVAKGPATNCISQRSSATTEAANPKVLLFKTGANRWYRNELRGSCPGLNRHRTLVFTNVTGGRYCNLDMFHVVDMTTHTRYGTCSLGQFTPVEVPKGTRF